MLGALAYRAWQSWQAGGSGQAAAAPAAGVALPAAFTPGATPAARGEPFELALIRVMIGAATAAGQEQGTQLWLAARMVLELDHAAERAFLDALAARLALPAELVAQLERQVQEATRPPQTACALP